MRIQRINTHEKDSTVSETIDTRTLHPIIEKYKDKRGSLIPILQAIQNCYGYLPEDAIDYIAQQTPLKKSDIYGVATFYAQFRLTPVGKHVIKVCHGTACHVQNANVVSEALTDILQVKDGETTPDGLFTLESVACLGCCSLAPVMMIDEDTYGKLNEKKAKKTIFDIQNNENKTNAMDDNHV